NREEFVVVGWTDPAGSRPSLGALLLAYYDTDGRLVYAGRVGTGISQAELARLWRRLQPLATSEMPLQVAPPRTDHCRCRPAREHDPARPGALTPVSRLAGATDNDITVDIGFSQKGARRRRGHKRSDKGHHHTGAT